MEYLFVYTLGLHSTSFSRHCATQGVYRNGESVYICTWGVVEYGASESMLHQNPSEFIKDNASMLAFSAIRLGTKKNCGKKKQLWVGYRPEAIDTSGL